MSLNGCGFWKTTPGALSPPRAILIRSRDRTADPLQADQFQPFSRRKRPNRTYDWRIGPKQFSVSALLSLCPSPTPTASCRLYFRMNYLKLEK